MKGSVNRTCVTKVPIQRDCFSECNWSMLKTRSMELEGEWIIDTRMVHEKHREWSTGCSSRPRVKASSCRKPNNHHHWPVHPIYDSWLKGRSVLFTDHDRGAFLCRVLDPDYYNFNVHFLYCVMRYMFERFILLYYLYIFGVFIVCASVCRFLDRCHITLS